jgi:hypothetical protein
MGSTVDDPSAVAWRVSVDYDDGLAEFTALLDALIADVGGENITGLSIGQWGGASHSTPAPVGLLVDKAPALPNLRALYLGDMDSEECEISWIRHGDITPLFTGAFPALEHVTVRGSDGLRLDPLKLPGLRTLEFESGGLPGEVARAVGESDLPALTRLELWLGTEDYGGTTTLADLADILAGTRLPALTWLGLRNSEIADEIAAAVATAPIVARLEVLDMSMGTLSNAGARALLAGQPLTHLRTLWLDHHYLSDDMMKRVVEELPGVRVHLDDQQDEDEYGPYVEVGE